MPYYYPQYYPQYQMQQQQAQAPAQAPQIQNGGFISVRSEDEARSYPVAPGMSVTFKNETAPFIYTKTMGFSQLDRPIFDVFKLQKVTAQEPQIDAEKVQTEHSAKYALASEYEAIKGQIDGILRDISFLKKEIGMEEGEEA